LAILEFESRKPKIHPSAYISPRATVIGEVEVGEGSSIWENVVLRGDLNSIKVGRYTSIQDNCTVHVDADNAVEIGDHVTVGHNAVIHGCRIGDYVLIGMGAVVLSRVEVKGPSIVGAGAVVTEDEKIPSHTLSLGVPAKIARRLREEDIDRLKKGGEEYFKLAQRYRRAGLKGR